MTWFKVKFVFVGGTSLESEMNLGFEDERKAAAGLRETMSEATGMVVNDPSGSYVIQFSNVLFAQVLPRDDHFVQETA